MFDYSDEETIAIWKRVKYYVDTDKIMGTSSDDVARQLEKEMKQVVTPKGKKGSMDRLVKAGFIQRLLKVDRVAEKLIVAKPKVKPKRKPRKPKVRVPRKRKQSKKQVRATSRYWKTIKKRMDKMNQPYNEALAWYQEKRKTKSAKEIRA